MFSERSIVEAGLNFELPNRIGIGNGDSPTGVAAGLKIGHRHAVEFVAVVVRARSVDEDSIVAGSICARLLPPGPNSPALFTPVRAPGERSTI